MKTGRSCLKKTFTSCRSCCGPSILDMEHSSFQGRVPFQMRYFFFLEKWVFGFWTGESSFETKQTFFLHDECSALWPVKVTSKPDKHLWKGELFNLLQSTLHWNAYRLFSLHFSGGRMVGALVPLALLLHILMHKCVWNGAFGWLLLKCSQHDNK